MRRGIHSRNNYNNRSDDYISVQKDVTEEINQNEKYPFVISLRRATLLNEIPKDNIWTGETLQLNVESIDPGKSTEMEMHPNIDEFLYIIQGMGTIAVGSDKFSIKYYVDFNDNNAFIIPAGMWYYITNTSGIPIKLFSINAASGNPFGT
jgi:mannose-6-phosphate isomerase-like protein (cupin superfamily)